MEEQNPVSARENDIEVRLWLKKFWAISDY